MQDNRDGSGEVTYIPTEPGVYMVHIRAGDEEIYGSPFCVNVRPYNAELRPSAVGMTNYAMVS